MELEIIEVFGVVIAAIIGAIALFRTTSLKHIEYRQRAVWFFEDYVGASARILDNATNDDLRKYKEAYMRYYIYAPEKIKKSMDVFDKMIKGDERGDKCYKLKKIIESFSDYYRMEQYIPIKNPYS